MTDKLFIESVKALDTQMAHDINCADAFQVLLPNDHTTLYDNSAVVSQLIKVLEDSVGDEEHWVSYFVYECEFGRVDNLITMSGIDYHLSSVEDLWDFLTFKK